MQQLPRFYAGLVLHAGCRAHRSPPHTATLCARSAETLAQPTCLAALQDALPDKDHPLSRCHASTQRPAFANMEHQRLSTMQAEQANTELCLVPTDAGQGSSGAGAPAGGASDQSTSWGGHLLAAELLACWPQDGLVKEEVEYSALASRSSSAQQLPPVVAHPAESLARGVRAQRAADEGEAPALDAAAGGQVVAVAGAVPRTPPGRRRTRSMSQQEAAAAAAEAAAAAAAGAPLPVLPGVLRLDQEQEGEEGETAWEEQEREEGGEEEQQDSEGRQRKRRRRQATDTPPASPVRQAALV